jgi:Lipopolysaccharide assembly protein A domain
MALVNRFVRVLIFLLGLLTGVVGTLFAIGNQNTIPISIWSYTFHVQVYLLALVPLGAGLLLGWVYTVPARTEEFASHWRSWRALRAMEKENKQLRKSLDRVLELPDGAAPALPAKREVVKLPAARDERLEAEPVVVHEVKQVVKARPVSKPKPAPTKAQKPASRRRAASAPASTPATNPA